MYASRYASGYLNTGPHMVGTARLDKGTDKMVGVIYVPGGGGLETSWQDDSATNPGTIDTIFRILCSDDEYRKHPGILNRFVTVQSNWTWGNQTEVNIISDAFVHAQQNYGFAPHKVHLMAASMGTVCVLNWATQNIGKVASIGLMLPAVNPQEMQDDNLVGVYGLPEPDTAFNNDGIIPDLYNPSENTGILSAAPIKMWYSNNDSVCHVDQVETFGPLVNAEMVNLGDMPPVIGITGHALNGIVHQEVVDFALANE